jgi:hypothetical protein
VSIPERSSGWPVRAVGDPHWIRATLKRWDNVTWRDPKNAFRTYREDLQRMDYFYRLVRDARPRVAVETGSISDGPPSPSYRPSDGTAADASSPSTFPRPRSR